MAVLIGPIPRCGMGDGSRLRGIPLDNVQYSGIPLYVRRLWGNLVFTYNKAQRLIQMMSPEDNLTSPCLHEACTPSRSGHTKDPSLP
jgi:hypothetical protein